jgi:hypothetical protein
MLDIVGCVQNLGYMLSNMNMHDVSNDELFPFDLQSFSYHLIK